MNRLKEKYLTEVLPKLREEYGIKNALDLPKITKVVVSIGIGEAKDNAALLEKVVNNITLIAGQKPVVTKAKKSIAAFKLSQGQPVGVMATLRGERMYQFLDKLMGVVLPKVRDFRGLTTTAFDGQGNYTLGIREQGIFPEIQHDQQEAGRGLEVSIISKRAGKERGKRLLELIGMPFKKEEK